MLQGQPWEAKGVDTVEGEMWSRAGFPPKVDMSRVVFGVYLLVVQINSLLT